MKKPIVISILAMLGFLIPGIANKAIAGPKPVIHGRGVTPQTSEKSSGQEQHYPTPHKGGIRTQHKQPSSEQHMEPPLRDTRPTNRSSEAPPSFNGRHH